MTDGHQWNLVIKSTWPSMTIHSTNQWPNGEGTNTSRNFQPLWIVSIANQFLTFRHKIWMIFHEIIQLLGIHLWNPPCTGDPLQSPNPTWSDSSLVTPRPCCQWWRAVPSQKEAALQDLRRTLAQLAAQSIPKNASHFAKICGFLLTMVVNFSFWWNHIFVRSIHVFSAFVDFYPYPCPKKGSFCCSHQHFRWLNPNLWWIHLPTSQFSSLEPYFWMVHRAKVHLFSSSRSRF